MPGPRATSARLREQVKATLRARGFAADAEQAEKVTALAEVVESVVREVNRGTDAQV